MAVNSDTVRLRYESDLAAGMRRDAESVSGVISKFKSLESEVKTFNRTASRETQQLERQLAQLKQSAGTDTFSTIGKGLVVGAAAISAATVAAGAMLARAGAEYTAAAGKFIVEATDLRTETEGAFARLLGSSQAGSKLFDKMLDVAAATGMKHEEALERARTLLNAGFDTTQIASLVRLFADFDKIKGEGKSEGLEKIFERVKAQGVFDNRAILMLARQGISTGAIYDELGKKMGKTRAEVEKMMAGGKKGQKIDSAQGIAAVMAVMKKRFGGAADVDSFADLWNAIKIQFVKAFSKIDVTPLRDALKSVLAVLQGPAGTKLMGAVKTLFGAIFHAIGDSFTGKAGTERLTQLVLGLSRIIISFAKIITSATPSIVKFFDWLSKTSANKGLGETIGSVLKTFNSLLGLFKDLASGDYASAAVSLLRMFTALGQAVGLIKPEGAKAIEKYLGVLERLKNAGKASAAAPATPGVDAPMPAAPATDSIGVQMANGVASGIQGGQSGIVSAMVNACQAAVSSAKAALQIASPSRIFAGIGAMTAAGMASGISGGSGGVARASAGLGNAAANAAGGGGSGLGSGVQPAGGAGGGGTTISVNAHYSPTPVNLQGAQGTDAAQQAQAIEGAQLKQFDGHLTTVLRQLMENG